MNFYQMPDKLHRFNRQKQILFYTQLKSYTLIKKLIITLKSTCRKRYNINQIWNKLLVLIRKKNINYSNLHDFLKILLDKLFKIRLFKCIINKTSGKLHNINERKQIVECVLLGPSKAYL